MSNIFKKRRSIQPVPSQRRFVGDCEMLEARQFLSGSHHGGGGGHGPAGVAGGGEIAFSLLPTAIQNGLTSLASTDSYTAPTSTTEVSLGNSNGVETYSIRETGTGTKATLTVDSTGAPVTAATKTTTTFGAVGNSAVTNEFTAIASALSLTAPASTDSVTVLTSNGTSTYRIGLTSTTTSGKTRTTYYTVDASGNPVGNERVPLSTLSTSIQSGLTSNAPSGATPASATTLINVQDVDGVTLYSVHYTGTGTSTTVSVNKSGALTSASTKTSVTFADVPAAASQELQSIATAKGVTGTIDSTTAVTKTVEANGTVLYTVRLSATSTTDSSKTYPVVITVDAAGNPTVAAGGGGGSAFGGRGGC